MNILRHEIWAPECQSNGGQRAMVIFFINNIIDTSDGTLLTFFSFAESVFDFQ